MKDGDLLSFRVLQLPFARDGEPNVMFLVEYKNWAAFDKGCDKELAYFQTLHAAYKGKGLTSLAVFREPDDKVEAYVKEKKLKMLYAVDSKGET